MNIPSYNGDFEITALSVTPKIAFPGDTVTISMTIKNVSGASLSKISMYMQLYHNTTGFGFRKNYWIKGGPTVDDHVSFSWKNNASKTFTLTFVPEVADDPTERTCGVRVEIDAPVSTAISDTGGLWDSFLHINDTVVNGVRYHYFDILTSRYTSSLTGKFYRADVIDGAVTEADESTTVAMDAKANLAQPYDSLFGATEFAHLYWSTGRVDISTATPNHVFTADELAALRNGFTGNTSLLAELTANLGNDYFFTLVYGDAYETAIIDNYNVAEAFANLALAGYDTGGACFGGFGTSEVGKPKLESHYRFYPYAGIEGVNIYKSGEIKTGGLWIDNKPIYRFIWKGTSTLDGEQDIVCTLPSTPETVISLRGMIKRTDGAWVPTPNAYFGSSNHDTNLRTDGGMNVLLGMGSGFNGTKTVIVIVEYTKPGDAPVGDFEGYAQLIDVNGYIVLDKNGYRILVKE